MYVPAYHNFKLIAPIDNVPAGATGELKRLDKHHVALIFDNHLDNYEDFVFDINDTDPAVWLAIRPHIVSPSLTDPPRRVFTWKAVALAAMIAVGFFEAVEQTTAYAQAVSVIVECLYF
jgi:hypothetical protein